MAGLFRESRAVKNRYARRLEEHATLAFDELYDIGDGSANAITAVVLDPSAWTNKLGQDVCERDVFQLFLAKLLEVGNDFDGRALKGISKLLAANADKMSKFMDAETFDAILSSLDGRLPIEVRSQATLASAKYLEVAPKDIGEETLVKFIYDRVLRHNSEDLVLAFSAAAALFPIAPKPISALFLTEGFVPSLPPLLGKKVKSASVEQAALDMMSAACVDSACREAISKFCVPWLENVLEHGHDPRPGQAAVILTKLRSPTGLPETDKVHELREEIKNPDDLVPLFKQMLNDDQAANQQSSMEGLAYASSLPKNKDVLTEDKTFLSQFLKQLKANSNISTVVFGGLTLIDHVTRYLPTLSEEQKRMAQLKAYANASKDADEPDPLDQDEAVTRRCRAIVDAGTVSAIVAASSNLSPASLAVVFRILLSVGRTPANRPTIVQQGGVRLLLRHYTRITGNTVADGQSRRTAAHALARMLISINPSLAFSSGMPPLTSAIRPLSSLLSDDPAVSTEDDPRDLLPVFEAAMALTNLASTHSDEATEMIVRLCFPTVEELLLSKNEMIQRAATELVCNLVTCSGGIEKFADESKAASRRIHVLLALADADDRATRSAAGGALAMLTEFEGAVKAILERERGPEILLRLCEDEDEGIVHRGIVCIRNCVTQHDIDQMAKAEIQKVGGAGRLRTILQSTKNRGILEAGVGALKALAI